MLVQIESGASRVTGLDDRQTDQAFETEFTARTNPHRGYITIIEGCDKFCAYCVVPYTRGKERSRKSQSVLDEARRIADTGYTDIQLLGQNVNSYRDPGEKMTFAELLSAIGELPGIRRVRFTTSRIPETLPATSSMPSTRSRHSAITYICPSRVALRASSSRCSGNTTNDQYLERIAWMKSTRNKEINITTDVIVGFPEVRTRSRVRGDAKPAGRGRIRRRVRLQVFAPAKYAVKAGRTAFRKTTMEVEMKIRGLMMDQMTNMPVVVLRERG